MDQIAKDTAADSMDKHHTGKQRGRWKNPWACSLLTIAATLLGLGALFLMAQSFLSRQLDPKGCAMSYMRPDYSKFDDFDREHTPFAGKYSLYLYREGGIDEDRRVSTSPRFVPPKLNGSR